MKKLMLHFTQNRYFCPRCHEVNPVCLKAGTAAGTAAEENRRVAIAHAR